MWKAMRLGGLCTLVIVGALPLSNAAEAAPFPPRYPQAITCSGGTSAVPNVIAGGTYASITVKGVCYVAAGTTITVGNLFVAPGATIDAAKRVDDQRRTKHHGLSRLDPSPGL